MNGTYIGLISGTSTDAVDAVAVDINNDTITQQATLAYPLDTSLKDEIFAIQEASTIDLQQLGKLDSKLGATFAQAAQELIANNQLDSKHILAIGSHGQTIKHDPDCEHPYSLQIGSPSMIAEKTGITTVADFRNKDIAAGGQGAPLVPAFHQAWLQQQVNTVVLNLGGIANITVLAEQSQQPQLGFDTGPANTLIDAWTRKHLHKPYDNKGQWASSGRVNKPLLDSLIKHPYFRKVPPKSADIGQFNLAWLENFLRMFPEMPAQDVAATLVELTVASIKEALTLWVDGTQQVIVCGGGSHNDYLIQELARHISPIRLTTSSEFGIHPDWVEATAFAWLARQTLLKKPGNAHHATGAAHPCVLGGIYYA